MEAFVYCWTDYLTNKLYIGSHKGPIDDGYVCSSKQMLQEYNKRPLDFSRQIIAEGNYNDIRKLESKILQSVNAALNEQFYNQHNADEKFHNKGHTKKTRLKISNTMKNYVQTEEQKKKNSDAQKGKKFTEEHKRKIGKASAGRKHTEDTKQKMSESAKKRKSRNL